MAIIFLVGLVIFWLVIAIMGSSGRFDNLSKTDDEKETKGCNIGCALILIVSFLLVCFKVFGFLGGIDLGDPFDFLPELRNPFH